MDAENLHITLPADMAQQIRRQVESGAFPSDSDVIRDAVRLWLDRQSDRQQRLEIIRTKLQEAADDPLRMTDDEVGRHFDERLAAAATPRTA